MKETEGAQGLCVSLAVALLLMAFFEVDVCVKTVLCFLSFSDVCAQLWCVCVSFSVAVVLLLGFLCARISSLSSLAGSPLACVSVCLAHVFHLSYPTASSEV